MSVDDPPPVMGTWNRLYALVLTVLAVQIVVYWMITAAYA